MNTWQAWTTYLHLQTIKRRSNSLSWANFFLGNLKLLRSFWNDVGVVVNHQTLYTDFNWGRERLSFKFLPSISVSLLMPSTSKTVGVVLILIVSFRSCFTTCSLRLLLTLGLTLMLTTSMPWNLLLMEYACLALSFFDGLISFAEFSSRGPVVCRARQVQKCAFCLTSCVYFLQDPV